MYFVLGTSMLVWVVFKLKGSYTEQTYERTYVDVCVEASPANNNRCCICHIPCRGVCAHISIASESQG